jgi:hypothetical protein
MRYITSYEVIEGFKIVAVEFATPYRILIHLVDGRTIVVDARIRDECGGEPAIDECAVLDVAEYEAGEV